MWNEHYHHWAVGLHSFLQNTDSDSHWMICFVQNHLEKLQKYRFWLGRSEWDGQVCKFLINSVSWWFSNPRTIFWIFMLEGSTVKSWFLGKSWRKVKRPIIQSQRPSELRSFPRSLATSTFILLGEAEASKGTCLGKDSVFPERHCLWIQDLSLSE
jgi:hypothetical protein